MLLQFRRGLLFGISITVLKDPNRPLMPAIRLDELIVTAFAVPAEELAEKSIPL